MEQRFPWTGADALIPRHPGGGPRVLSFAQERMWFLERFSPGTGAHTLPVSARLRGPVDAELLRSRLDALVARHESLRMTFPPGADGLPRVRVAAAPKVPLRVVRVKGPGLARSVLSADAALAFDLAEGPLLRATLVRYAPDEHALLIAVHQIVCDAWSAELIMRELLASGPVPGPAVRYGDYALWQRERLAGPYLERHLAFWRAELDGLPALDLPLDAPRPARQGYAGAWYEVWLAERLTSAVKLLAGKQGATTHMAFLAAFQALLAGWSGQRDFAVGSPVAGRSRPELAGLVGLFENLLPFRARLAGDPTFAELLERTRYAALDVYAHQELPFEKLVAELDLSRDVGRPPVAQALFALRGHREGAAPEPFRLESPTTRFDLELHVTETTGGMTARFVYNRALFGADTVARLATRFVALLEWAVTAPDVPVGELEIRTADEQALVDGWNATARRHPGGTLHGLVFEQAARTPDAPAAGFEGSWLTYRELTERAQRVAAALRAAGARPDQPVGVHLSRCLDLPVALLGVLAAGCAYLPLEPGHPEERLRGMLADAGATLVVTNRDLAFPGGLLVEDAERMLEAAPVDVPEDALAYVIFTSGSTGRPKGVAVSHRAIVNRLRWMQRVHHLDGNDRVLHKTPTTFDVSVWELFWPLVAGAAVVIARPDCHRDTAYLRDLLHQEQVTTAHFVPSMLEPFLAEKGGGGPLRRVICSGEVLPPGLVRRFAELLPGVELHNLYGPTEAAVDVSWHRCTPGEEVVPIGRPVDNTRLHILDRHLNPVPIGTPGELHIAGTQLARGYTGRPGLTADRFLPDPYGPPGSRLYATGDLARWRRNGEIEFLGRLDDQIKVRGMRVEPGEVEAVLREQPGVRDAVVTGHDGGLIGYVVGEPPPGLRDRLRATLPEHLIPTAWVRLDALPLSTSGKLDRSALPPPAPPADVPWEPPAGEAELAVARVWQAVLGLERVGRRDEFFAVGGDSIRGVKVVARLRAAGYEVDLRDLFAHPAVAELAAVLRVREDPALGLADRRRFRG
ncbi:amino acid adenylation domain-containing protein [Nonomuraea sp. NPDC046570]|uniref:amino acid adenylation domain-containing protein n=1 Tax=Nonomuraea sp. NPDC046570 TaxID=3155255 RepID=UPI0033F6A6B7